MTRQVAIRVETTHRSWALAVVKVLASFIDDGWLISPTCTYVRVVDEASGRMLVQFRYADAPGTAGQGFANARRHAAALNARLAQLGPDRFVEDLLGT